MKPGWQTSEFWIALIGQVLAVLALTGAIRADDRAPLESALAGAVTAVFAIVSSASIVVRYIRSRTELKSQALASDAERPLTPPPVLPSLLAVVIGALLFAAPLHAAPPPAPTCLFGGRQPRTDPAVIALLQQLAQNQQTIISLLQQRAPAPAPIAPQPLIIMVPGPRQDIPLGGAPRQDIPLGGPPRQDIPLGGPPRQDIPLGGPPRQDIQLGPPLRQDIPLGPVAPRQQIPLGDPRPPGEVKPAPSAMQRYIPR
ncbi:hypothetical protein AYO44_10470 [Planctomycetaceae bacterium SCGC AG-212-F19]|nr:hypothetical protein AYO44_10470 [Planctomycetaceae bacterium SCGC AG-212-F19]